MTVMEKKDMPTESFHTDCMEGDSGTPAVGPVVACKRTPSACGTGKKRNKSERIHIIICVRLADALVKEGEFEEARGIIDDVVAVYGLKGKEVIGDMCAERGYEAVPFSEAMEYLVEASDAGRPWAQVTLGKILLTGYSVRRDPEKAVELLRPWADKGMGTAVYWYSLALIQGLEADRPPEMGAEMLRRGAENGSALCMAGMSCIYGAGIGVPRSEEAAEEWDRRSKEAVKKRRNSPADTAMYAKAEFRGDAFVISPRLGRNRPDGGTAER